MQVMMMVVYTYVCLKIEKNMAFLDICEGLYSL